MKRILVIGAGFLQSFVIKKAKEMGYYTLTIDKNPNSIGFTYADEYKVIDITDQEACLQYAKTKNIDGVLTAATDFGVVSVAHIAKQMNLPGLNYKVAKLIKNKYKVRHVLYENRVDDISQYYEISNTNALNDIQEGIRYPVMVKPCDGSGSKAARRVNSKFELKNALEEAITASYIGKALIENFIEGKEFGVESFVYKGEVYVLGVIGKSMTDPPNYAELGHFYPSQLGIEEQVKAIAKKAIQALKIDFGAVNMDVLVTKNNEICIIDIGARMGGNLIGSHIIPLGVGIDYIGNLIRSAVNEPINLNIQDQRKIIATRILSLQPGTVVSLPNFGDIETKCQVNIYQNMHVGSVIKEYQNNLDGCGYVVSLSNKTQAATHFAEKAKEMIDIGIIRKSIKISAHTVWE